MENPNFCYPTYRFHLWTKFANSTEARKKERKNCDITSPNLLQREREKKKIHTRTSCCTELIFTSQFFKKKKKIFSYKFKSSQNTQVLIFPHIRPHLYTWLGWRNTTFIDFVCCFYWSCIIFNWGITRRPCTTVFGNDYTFR